MTREQVAAAVIAGLIGVLAYDYKRYRWWAHWSRLSIALALLVFALLNGLVGYLGALGAQATDWSPAGESAWLSNSLAFAGLSEAVVRTLIRGSGSGPVEGPSTPLGHLLSWLEGAFDTVAEDAVKTHVIRDLTDDQRRQLAGFIMGAEVGPDPSFDEALKQERARWLDATLNLLAQGGAGAAVARGQVNGFLSGEITSRRLTRA